MQAPGIERKSRRRPLFAQLLSALGGSGMGHFYCGRFVKGLVLSFINLVAAAIGMFALLPFPSSYRITGIVALVIGSGLWMYAIVDSGRIAKKTSPSYALKDYNRWYVYLLLVLLDFPLIIGWAFHVRAGMVEAFYITSENMCPTIRSGERVLVSKLVYRTEPLRRGDIVVFRHPNERHRNFIQRVVGRPADTVEIRDNELYLNGEKLGRIKISDWRAPDDETLRGEIFQEINGAAKYDILLTIVPDTEAARAEDTAATNYPKTQVPNGHCFVLGDNRNHASDSREFGPIPLFDIIGRAEYIYLPRWVNLKTHAHE